jgi:hypothetical protein
MNNLLSYEDHNVKENKEFLTNNFVNGSIKILYTIGNLLDNTKSLLSVKNGIPYKVSQIWTNLTNFTLRLMLNMNKDLDGVIEEYKKLNNSSIFKDIGYLEEFLEIQIMDSEDNELRQKKLEKRLNNLMELSKTLKTELIQGKMTNNYVKK